jgi:hypothetical protein
VYVRVVSVFYCVILKKTLIVVCNSYMTRPIVKFTREVVTSHISGAPIYLPEGG